MRYIKKLPIIVKITCLLLTLLPLLNNKVYSKEVRPGKTIIIELDFIPSGVKPGDKPITLAPDLLKELFPELKNPRLMSLKDLDDTIYEQEDFVEGGYTFVLRGDFNKDGFADLAFVGKYDNPIKPKENSFIAIISIKGKKVMRDFFSEIEREKISLIKVLDYKPKIDAIGMVFTIPSDDCGYLYWTGKKYEIEACKAVFP